MEDVDACDLSGIRYAVNATLHDNEASFAFDEKCKEQGITVIHAVNLLTSSLRHPKILIKEFSYFLMPCHQHGLRINLLV